jgi:hypothetical protein
MLMFVNVNVTIYASLDVIDHMLLWTFFQVCLPYYHGANNYCKNLSVHSVQINGAKIVQKYGA